MQVTTPQSWRSNFTWIIEGHRFLKVNQTVTIYFGPVLKLRVLVNHGVLVRAGRLERLEGVRKRGRHLERFGLLRPQVPELDRFRGLLSTPTDR